MDSETLVPIAASAYAVCFFYWSSEGGTAVSETLVPFATSAEAVATVESQILGGTMDLETLVPIADLSYHRNSRFLW